MHLRVSGYTAQLSDQAAVLTALTKLVKAGQYVDNLGVPSSVVLVGHSFGSAVSVAALGADSSLAAGVVLTGEAANIGSLRDHLLTLVKL